VEKRLRDLRIVPVYLSEQEVKGFYEDAANGMLWPLFHYLVSELPLNSQAWDTYRAVNEKIAAKVAEHYRPGDIVWIQDYQLLLVPSMLRRRIPEARIGFFLHIPFPSSEVFAILPWRKEILEGLLGADLIGMHTPGYLRHFATSLRRVLGIDVDVDCARYMGREVMLGVFPMGIDTAAWSAHAADPEIEKRAEEIRREAGGRKIILGMDRLDYTKGILQRLLAVERLLENEPSLRDQFRFIQVTVPSREKVEAYADLRHRIDELVGRINGRFATASAVPIHRLHRSLPEVEVGALYRAADVMLVTPLRDGMNLVAKEFVATRADTDGVLILSEFAGVASELGEALHVNPYDADRVAERIREALAMPESVRRYRMRALRMQVLAHDVRRWAANFIGALEKSTAKRAPVCDLSSSSESQRLVHVLRRSRLLVLILDYDGTLIPFTKTPEKAAPDKALKELLGNLASRPGTRVHVVTGRSRRSMEKWLGRLPIGIHAEHGLWSRLPGENGWRQLRPVSPEWLDKVRSLMEHFTASTHGTFIDEKTASIVWDYRMATADFMADDDFGEFQARELRVLLSDLLSNEPVEVLSGDKFVEVRQLGIHKGHAVPLMLAAGPGVVLAVGDDGTDEDLFASLPDGALTVHVGDGSTKAKYRIGNPDEVRLLLSAIVE
jgi:trehalose 6-phosphate synthase/phosphatase